MDPLSDLLRVVRLDGAFFYAVEAAEPWSVESKPLGPARYAGAGSRDGQSLAESAALRTIGPAGPAAGEREAGGGVTWDVVHELNAGHAREHEAVTKEAALDLLRRNSAAAAAAIRALSDAQLDQAAPVSLNADAPLTCQFMLEDHAVRHSYHHLERLRGALGRKAVAA